MSDGKVYLECVKEGSKLRVKILTPGYISGSNCQFPKDIRVVGRKYEVPASDVNLVTGRGRWFYRIGKNNIKIVDQIPTMTPSTHHVHVARIFEDAENPACAICLDLPKSRVFVPCGHYMCCETCYPELRGTCPMCRSKIQQAVPRDLVD